MVGGIATALLAATTFSICQDFQDLRRFCGFTCLFLCTACCGFFNHLVALANGEEGSCSPSGHSLKGATTGLAKCDACTGAGGCCHEIKAQWFQRDTRAPGRRFYEARYLIKVTTSRYPSGLNIRLAREQYETPVFHYTIHLDSAFDRVSNTTMGHAIHTSD